MRNLKLKKKGRSMLWIIPNSKLGVMIGMMGIVVWRVKMMMMLV